MSLNGASHASKSGGQFRLPLEIPAVDRAGARIDIEVDVELLAGCGVCRPVEVPSRIGL